MLQEKYGELLSYQELGKILKRSEGGLRWVVNAGTGEFSEALRSARRKLGKRTMFRTTEIERLIN